MDRSGSCRYCGVYQDIGFVDRLMRWHERLLILKISINWVKKIRQFTGFKNYSRLILTMRIIAGAAGIGDCHLPLFPVRRYREARPGCGALK